MLLCMNDKMIAELEVLAAKRKISKQAVIRGIIIPEWLKLQGKNY